MKPLTNLEFPYHIGDNYSFARVDYDYNFSTIQQIIDLNTYMFCAIDQQFNLHFIQYRDCSRQEKIIKPPSFATPGKGNIKFTLEYHRLKTFLFKRPLKESDYLSYLMDRGSEEEGWPDCTFLGDNRLAIKLNFDDPVFVVYFDSRIETHEPIILPSLKDILYLRAVNSSKIIFYALDIKRVMFFCLNTHRCKILNFTYRPSELIKDIRSIPNHNMAIGVYNDCLEVLNLEKNTVVERAIFLDAIGLKLCVDTKSNSGTFISYYTVNRGLVTQAKLIIKIWVVKDRDKVESSLEVKLMDNPKNASIQFLTKDHVAVIDKTNRLKIFRISEKGAIQVVHLDIPLDLRYELAFPKRDENETNDDFGYRCFVALDQKHFVALRGNLIDLDAERQKIYLFSYAIEQTPLKIFDLYPVDQLHITDFEALQKEVRNIKMEILVDYMPDKVVAVTYWRSSFVLFLTQSKKLFCYDISKGTLKVVFNMMGIEPNKATFKKLEALNNEEFALLFTNTIGYYRILVLSMKKYQIIFDSQKNLEHEITIVECTVENGKIYIQFRELDEDNFEESFIGALDYHNWEINQTSDIYEDERMYDFKVTENQIAVGTSTPRDDMTTEVQRVMFFSLPEKKMLYAKNVNDFLPSIRYNKKVINIECLKGDLLAILIKMAMGSTPEEEEDCYVVIWDIQKQKKIAQLATNKISHLLGLCGNSLLISLDTTSAQSIGELNLSKFLFPTKSIKDESKRKSTSVKRLKMAFWEFFIPEVERNCFKNLDPQKNVLALYDKKIYPNSLLFVRKRNIKLECLRFIHKELSSVYHPYLKKEVMETIFGVGNGGSDDATPQFLCKGKD